MKGGLDPETYRPGNLFYENTVFGLTGTLGRDARNFMGDIEESKSFAQQIYGNEDFANMYTVELLEDVLARLNWAAAMVADALEVKEARNDR